ncbi:hypothetical protein [Streptosporangium sp. KLBMP 9127]|nr:hypothetical protein [Streptosporangium sp. KLBMP 9127]
MRSVKQAMITVLALATLLMVSVGAGTAWASTGDGTAGTSPVAEVADGFSMTEWDDLPDNLGTSQAAADSCIPVAGPGVRMTFYCDLSVRSTLWVYCEGVTIEIRMNPGRWAPSGSCPGYRGYRLVPAV